MVKTILLCIYVVVSMIFLIPFGVIAIIFHTIGFRKSMKQVFYRIAQGWGLSMIKLSGCKVTVTGRENIPKKGGVCFVSNHGGYFDIVLLLAYSGRLVGFVAKKELFLVPFLNIWIYMLGGLFIDRSTLRKANRTIKKGVEKIKSGGGLIIFPEGHRSMGRGLLPFHPGSLKLATMAEAPIIPTALEGSYELWEKTKRVVKTDLKVTFCEPINTASLPATDRKLILSDRIYSVIKEKLGK
jgi:1-acyl-sn-glycerol-3-phosphate acyltransferase